VQLLLVTPGLFCRGHINSRLEDEDRVTSGKCRG
jgi:hypothetical protein